MTDQTRRALIVTRLSKVSDATTSPERQREICEELCQQRGYEVVGIAEDLDVSGSVDPFNRRKRPNLARWLANEEQPFDLLVAYRVDRFTRSIRHLQQLVNWADDHGKLVVSATEAHFDTTSPFAAVVIALMGTVAQMELEAISERNASKSRRDIKLGKYRGSTPPWGYLPEKVDGVWRLLQDKAQVDIIEEVVRRLLDHHQPMQRIAHDLTRRGVLTPKDHFARHRGRKVEGREWSVTQLKRSLLSETMLGYAMSGGEPVRNDDGSPVIRSEPILTREQFDALRVELENRSRRGEPSRASSSLLLRVIYCGMPCSHKQGDEDSPGDCTGVCGEPVYKFNGGSHSQFPRYRCRTMTKAHKCGNRTIRTDEIDRVVEHTVLTLLGESERLERVWDSGCDNSTELSDVEAELSDITGIVGTGPYKAGTPLRAQLDARIAGLTARYETLSSEVVKPSGWSWQGTGEQFSDWWERQDTEGKNIWLRAMNVRIEYDRDQIRIDAGDLTEMARQVSAAGPIADMLELFQTMRDNNIQGITRQLDGTLAPTPCGTDRSNSTEHALELRRP
ncbi:recombinase family protein [Mycobacterium florentinum]|uniref:recombinase family protein n=1 Tax=Mycobacterium florentinum TaxID=292462 RepID=UPI000A1563F9|nr:recombinase family protein [Mycobacterium florentinum]MCV7409223.1 recombinase family protein [Mycobacterium florentinum]BBX78652.1 integrase [Mycobacterium florentinum]